MKNSDLSFARIAGVVVLVGIVLVFRTDSQPVPSFTARVSREYFFPQPLLWVGQAPHPAESQFLWELLDAWRATGGRSGLEDLEQFLDEFPTSAWAPSLSANLGKYYRERGRYTLALEHWELAWEATKQFPPARASRSPTTPWRIGPVCWPLSAGLRP